MRTDLFDYLLPDELIARYPTEARDGARMLVVARDRVEHDSVRQWPERVETGSLVVLNQTKVLRARLLGVREPGRGRVEIFLLRRLSVDEPQTVQLWEALGRANRPLRAGTHISVGEVSIRVSAKRDDGTLVVEIRAPGDVNAALERVGEVPIPPYLKRRACAMDGERYQTVYARESGSVAAPTAGLHVTDVMLGRLAERGVRTAYVTLHVGAGTFKPVEADDLEAHTMHREWFHVPDGVAAAIAETRHAGGKVVAVGTTVVRALESAADPDARGLVRATSGETRIMIRPGVPFRVVDALLTNFHQPRSTLLALVSAFAGRKRVLNAYEAAIRAGYRFLSYGDAMWIPARIEEEDQEQ